MGRVILDADWNEEVAIRTADARRRTADASDGAPSDGYQVNGNYNVDPMTSVAGWTGVEANPSLLGTVTPEISLGRYEPASLPFVIRARGHISIKRLLPAGREFDLNACVAPSIGVGPIVL